MRNLLILIVVGAAAAGAYIYLSGGKTTVTEADKPTNPNQSKPSYVKKFEKKDFEGAYTEAKEKIEKTEKPEDPNLYYVAAQSALELGREQEAEGFARTLIGPGLKGKLAGQKKACKLGKNFYMRFVSQAEPNKDLWMITRDLLGIGLHSKPEDVNEVIAKIEKLNKTIEFSDTVVKGTVRYTIQPKETLGIIAKKFKTNDSMIARINGIKNLNIVHAGQTIKVVPGGNYNITIDKSQFKLTVFREGIYIKAYKVGVGLEGKETPTGETTIITRQIHPPWTRIGHKSVPYGDPEYPLGERWMSFDKKNFAHYGIHGTNDDHTIGKKSSNGCIRLTNTDVIELFDLVTIGTKVKIQE